AARGRVRRGARGAGVPARARRDARRDGRSAPREAARYVPEALIAACALRRALVVADHLLDDLVHADARPVADRGLDLGEIRDAAPHVLEALAVGLLVGDLLDRGR